MLAASASSMTGLVPVVSATVTVVAGTNNFYAASRFTDINGADHDSTTLPITITVLASPATDVIPPSTIGVVTATGRGATAIDLSWPAATDNVAVAQTEIFSSVDAVTYFLIKTITAPTATATVMDLLPSTLYYIKLRAVDTSANPSAAFSAPITFTTEALIDLTQPSTPTNLRVLTTFTTGATLQWDPGTDTGFGSTGSVTTTVEVALSTAGVCGTYTQKGSNISITTFQPSLAAGTAYCARIIHTDAAGNVSMDYSNVVPFTTTTTGLIQPRSDLPINAVRGDGTRGALTGTRPTKP